MKNKRRKNKDQFLVKTIMCLIYLIIMTILFVCSYHMFQEKKKIIPWQEVKSIEDYAYIDISKMSEKFAYYEEENIGLHFVIEEEETGLWHTFVIAIDEDNYDTYKPIIDYTYERVEEEPNKIRVYGYPVNIDEDIKTLAIKNIVNFVPAENEVEITDENYEKYLTNSYLDTTLEREETFDVILCVSLLLLFIVMALFFLTIIDKKRLEKVGDKE